MLPAAISRNGMTEPTAMERADSSSGPRSCRDDDCCTHEKRLTYVPTPSTFGRRTPENLPRSVVRRVSFALRRDSDADFGEESPRKKGCLKRSIGAGRRTRDNSPTTPARRVSFAAFDEVVHIPAEKAASSEDAPGAQPRSSAALPQVA